MATLHAAHAAVMLEIRERIEALEPAAQRAHRFIWYSDQLEAARPIDQYSGAPRVFRLGESVCVERVSSGHTYSREIHHAPLTIAYPTGGWESLIADDLNKIRADLLTNKTEVAGVAYRFLAPAVMPVAARSSADSWQLVTVPVEIMFDTTAS